nr:hypothetical protein [Tanacetum cinerariifolium]
EEDRQVHATHARIVTAFVPKPAKRRKTGKVTFDPPQKLKGVPSLTSEEQEAADIMQALKESKRQPGTGTKPGVLDEENEITEENVILEWGSEQDSEYSKEDKLDDEEKDDKEGDVDDEDDEIESDKDDIYKYKICVHKDKDEEMLNAEVDDSNKGDEEVTDRSKADVKKSSEVKDDPKKVELPPTSSSLSVSFAFGDQFHKLSSDSSLYEVPHTLSPSMLSVPVFTISEPTVLTPVQESPSIITATTLPHPSVSTTPFVTQQTTTPIPTPTITTDSPIITTVVSDSNALSAVQLRVAKLEKDMSNLKKLDLSTEALAALKTQVPSVIDNYLGSKVGDVFQKEMKKHTEDFYSEILSAAYS